MSRPYRCVAVLFFCLTAALPGQTKLDGSRYHGLTTGFETPHLEWGDKLRGGPVRALFVVSLSQARLVVEAAQRMPLALAAVTTALRTYDLGITRADDRYYGELYTGTSPSAKAQELLNKLDGKYEVFVIARVDLAQVPARAKLRILEQVYAGAGLVLYDVRGTRGLAPIFARPDADGQTIVQALAPADPTLKTYRFGKGRIAMARHMNIARFHYHGPEWWTDFENANVLTMRTLLWAAGRALRTEPPQLVNGVATGAAGARIRLRDRWNTVCLETADTRVQLPPLPTGTYCLDFVADPRGPGIFTFPIDAGYTAELTTDSDAIDGFGPIRAVLRVNRPVLRGRAVVSLFDSPYQREWYRQEMPLGDSKDVSVTVRDCYMPTLAAYLRVRVFADETPVATADRVFYFPWYHQHPPVYGDTMWEYNPAGMDRIRAMAEHEAMGYSGVLNRIDGDRPGVQTYMRLNIRHGAHNFGFALGLGGKKALPHRTDEENALIASLNGNFSPGDPDTEPAIRAVVRSMIRHKSLDRYPLSFYGMGNETKVSYTEGFTEADSRFFQEMLRKRYGTIESLNAEWRRNYLSFAHVRNMPMEEARVQGLYPEYLAHRRLIDETVRRRVEIITEEVHKVDPHAHLGCDGTWSLSNDGINMEELLANPRVNHWEQYSRLPRAEVLRSLRPDAAGFLWGWIISNDSYPTAPWFNLLIGCGNHANWFLSGCSVGGTQLAADYRPWRPRMVEELEKLRTGVAQLLNTTPLHPDGLAIWESYNSNVAGLLGDPRLPRSTDTSMPLIEHCYQRGITFDFVARRGMAGKLANYKVLVLPGATAISTEEEREMLAFVRRGGTTIADLSPGIMNDSFAFIEQNRLADLFGRLDPEARPERGPLAINTKLSGKAIRFACDAANRVPGIEPFTVRQYGKGRAILLNFTLGSARESADPAAFTRFLDDLLTSCGVSLAVELTSLPPASVARVRRGGGYTVIGVTHRRLAAAGRDGQDEIVLRLPEAGHVYAVDEGSVAHTDRVTFTLTPPFRLFSVFASAQVPPPLRLSGGIAIPGTPLCLDLTPFPAGRVLRVQLRDGAGRLVNPRAESVRREVIVVGAEPEHRLHFPYNAAEGDYRLTLTDVVTGLSNTATIKGSR